MSERRRTRPQLVYDDDCGFCTWCARWAVRVAPVDAVGFDELTDEQRARLPDDWEECAHLLVGRTVYSCGEAIEQTLARSNIPASAALGLLRQVPGYAAFREESYRWAADHRDWWGQIRRADSVE
ncbi:DCC1-like thiol-disulfide oxidoreductase family protein [Halomarina salina]|uniref:DCC1-like thiol-disulfide oxidoreductase family protein n=1 Tax=Halomarina salina TaxID=1872699 RepID=A0ABD5RN88_9EURY|nr:DCC1-like thiol-disulfide oxidoreductase family protein [Halomarina salina]